jgi:hypothetical protein
MTYTGTAYEYIPSEDAAFASIGLVRATVAAYADKNGVLQSAANNVWRDGHYINGVRSALMEPQRTNWIVRSEDFATTWTASLITRTGGQADPKGGNSAFYIQASPSGSQGELDMNSVAGLTNGASASLSLFVKRGYHVPANGSEIGIFDATAAVWRGSLLLQWTGDTPVLTARNGASGVRSERYKNGWWRIQLTTSAITSANANRYVIQVNDDSVTDPDADLYIYGAQLESGTSFATSYIPTTGAAATRNGDVSTIPLISPFTTPQAMTIYIKFVELGLAKRGGFTRLLQIGDATTGRKTVNIRTNNSLRYDCVHEVNAGPGVSSDPGVAPADGDVVEIRAVISSSGAVLTGQSINGGAEVLGAQSAGLAFDPNWANAGGAGDVYTLSSGPVALQRLRFALGVQTMATMQMPATYIYFVDSIGPVLLSNEKAFPADRFSGWTPNQIPFGESAQRMSDRKTFMFKTSEEFSVSLQLSGIPSKSSFISGTYTPLDLANRFIYHVTNGGVCLVRTGDAIGSSYSPCAIYPDSKPSIQLTDKRLLEYTLSAQLINVATVPVPFSSYHR